MCSLDVSTLVTDKSYLSVDGFAGMEPHAYRTDPKHSIEALTATDAIHLWADRINTCSEPHAACRDPQQGREAAHRWGSFRHEAVGCRISEVSQSHVGGCCCNCHASRDIQPKTYQSCCAEVSKVERVNH